MSAPRTILRPGSTRRMAAALAAAWFFVAVILVPAAQAGFFSFDLKDEKELGEKFNALIRARMPIIEDTEIDDYLNGILQRLVKAKAPMPWPIKLSVINNNAINAFAGPAGYVFVFTGLLLHMDPDYQDLHEKLNSALLGSGPVFCKFTGHRGKVGANDAHPEYVAWLRNLLDGAGVPWQMAELGRVDLGGGGTVAKFLAVYGMMQWGGQASNSCEFLGWASLS